MLSVPSPSVSIWNPLQHPCPSVTDLTQTKALLTLLVEGRAERRKGKRWKNRAYLQSFLLWHHTCCAISQNQEVEVQGSGMQGQTSLCSGLRGTTTTGITNPATEMQTLFFSFVSQHYKIICGFFRCYSKAVVLKGVEKTSAYALFTFILNKTINSVENKATSPPQLTIQSQKQPYLYFSLCFLISSVSMKYQNTFPWIPEKSKTFR